MAPLISAFRDWCRKRYGEHGQGHIFFPKDNPLIDLPLACVVGHWGNLSERAIPGLIQPVMNVDCLGQLHAVPHIGAFPVVVGPDGLGPRKLNLRHQIRYTANDEEVDVVILAADPNRDLYIGRILVDPWPEDGRGDYQVYVKEGANRFPFSSDSKNNNATYVKKNFEHNFPIPPVFINRDLMIRTAGDGITNDTIFDVFVYSVDKPTDVTYTIV